MILTAKIILLFNMSSLSLLRARHISLTNEFRCPDHFSFSRWELIEVYACVVACCNTLGARTHRFLSRYTWVSFSFHTIRQALIKMVFTLKFQREWLIFDKRCQKTHLSLRSELCRTILMTIDCRLGTHLNRLRLHDNCLLELLSTHLCCLLFSFYLLTYFLILHH